LLTWLHGATYEIVAFMRTTSLTGNAKMEVVEAGPEASVRETLVNPVIKRSTLIRRS
jgi:hypothetical protein